MDSSWLEKNWNWECDCCCISLITHDGRGHRGYFEIRVEQIGNYYVEIKRVCHICHDEICNIYCICRFKKGVSISKLMWDDVCCIMRAPDVKEPETD